MCKQFDGDFYDFDYFQRGRESKKGWLENYRFLPRRTFREAFAFIDALGLDEKSYVLEFGCAMGFLVKALRTLEIKADGCDISKYALSFSPHGCWNCEDDVSWLEHKYFGYTHIIVKDVLEHLTIKQLEKTLSNFALVSSRMMCVIPMGDGTKYNIPEYECEISHIIKEDENWWSNKFEECGWRIIKECNHLSGLKDNWAYCENGNHVFVLEHR